MHRLTFLVLLSVACGTPGDTLGGGLIEALNGSFEVPATYPPPAVLEDGNLFHPYPVRVPSGWEIEPAAPWPGQTESRNRWHEGIHLRYGGGRNPLPPDGRYPEVPNGTALFVNSCAAWEAGLCEYPWVLKSAPVPAPGTRVRVTFWGRSFRWQEWYPASDGLEVGLEVDGSVSWQNAGPVGLIWSPLSASFQVRAGAEARVAFRIEKTARDIYLDDVALLPE